MNEPEQLAFLADDGSPTFWPCPTCRGSGWREGEHPAVFPHRPPGPCRPCHGTGRVSYDPDDYSEFPEGYGRP